MLGPFDHQTGPLSPLGWTACSVGVTWTHVFRAGAAVDATQRTSGNGPPAEVDRFCDSRGPHIYESATGARLCLFGRRAPPPRRLPMSFALGQPANTGAHDSAARQSLGLPLVRKRPCSRHHSRSRPSTCTGRPLPAFRINGCKFIVRTTAPGLGPKSPAGLPNAK